MKSKFLDKAGLEHLLNRIVSMMDGKLAEKQPVGDYALNSNLGELASKDVVSREELAIDVQESLENADKALLLENANLEFPWTGSSLGKTIIGYGDGKFVAVYDAYPAYSTNGLSWTQNESDWLNSDSWGGIAYGNGVFVVVPSAYQDRQVWYYHDGRWDSSYMHTDDESSNDSYCDWTSVAYGNGKFVAVGNNHNSGYGCMAWSADGSEWTRLSGDVIEQNVWTHVVYGNGTFMAFGSNNMDIYCSTDGINWTQGGNPSSMSSSMLLAYAKDKFFLVDGYRINYSTDGQMWTTVDLGDYYSIEQVVYGNNKFVALLYDSRVMISEDGTSWQLCELPIFEYSYGDHYIVFGNGKFIATNYEGYLATSSDGINWTSEYSALIQNNEDVTEIVKEMMSSGGNGSILYTEQSLTDEQKAQTRENIGAQAIIKGVAGQVVGFDANGNPVAQAAPSGGGGGGTVVSTDAVLYTPQTLTDAQKTQARANIGAGTSSNATTSAAGLMSAADKIKLNSLSNVSIDTTLAVSGAAADAKTTGDKFTELSGMLESVGGGVTVANNPNAIHWDGTIGDRVWVPMGEGAPIALVRLYDDVPDLSAHLALGLTDMIPIMVSMTIPGEGSEDQAMMPMVTQGGLMMGQRQEDGFVMSEAVFIVPYDGYVLDTITFPKKGIYGIAYSLISQGIDTSIMHVSGVAIAGNDFSESGGGKYFETKTETTTINIGDTLMWDGNVGDKDYAQTTIDTATMTLVRMADNTPTYEELSDKTITVSSASGDTINPSQQITLSAPENDGEPLTIGGAIVVYSDGYTLTEGSLSITFPKAGIYFQHVDNNGTPSYVCSLNIPDYNFVITTASEEHTYLKNEHLSILETVSGNDGGLVGDTLTWDGESDGLYYFEESIAWSDTVTLTIKTVRVSDSTPVVQEGEETILVSSDGQQSTASWGFNDDNSIASITFAASIVYSPYDMFEQTGIYMFYLTIADSSTGETQTTYTQSLTIPNANLNKLATKGKSVIKYEYLPEALQFGEMYAYGDTITWDGDTTGLVNAEGILFHVSDTVLTIDDFANGASISITTKQTGSDPVTETYNLTIDDIVDVDNTGLIIIGGECAASIPPSIASQMGVPAGIYFLKIPNDDGSITYTSSFTLPNSDKLYSKTIVKIDPKYLPDGYGSGSGSTGGTTGGGTSDDTTVTLQSLGVTASATELNYVKGVTSSIQTQLNNKAASSHTHTLSELGVTASATELNYVDGVTSNIQTQLNKKSDSTHTHTLSSLGVTASTSELNKLDGVTATTTELNYVDGVTSNIQTQLDDKAPAYTYGTTDLSAGVSLLATGKLYFVYE